MNERSLGIDEGHGADLSMRASQSSHLPYCYLENHRGRVVKYVIRNLDGDPYVSGEKLLKLLGWTGTQVQVEL